MCPSGKKIELFGRPHNCQKNWITLGNQLPGHYLLDKDIIKNYKETLENLEKIYKITDHKLPLKQIGVYYNKNDCKNKYCYKTMFYIFF